VTFILATRLVIGWHRLEAHVRAERDARHQPGHMRKFELLAIAAKSHRDEKKRDPQEETFQTNPEQLNGWKKALWLH
jgi:hypothetical protein